jgi:hypothetical protein
VNAEQNAKTQPPGTGIFALLANLLRFRGSSAPSCHSSVRRMGLLTALAAAGLLVAAGPAAAESAWWHVASGSRPTYLNPGTAQSEVQEVNTAPGTYEGNQVINFYLQINGKRLPGGEFATEPVASEFGLPLPTAANIQQVLEAGPYGVGRVQVTEEPLAAGVVRYLITSVGEGADQAVPHLEVFEEIGTASSKVITKGRPDGEIYFTAENLGDASLTGLKSPVELSDVLPPGLKAVAIEASTPSEQASFTTRLPLPCELATLTCTLGKNTLAEQPKGGSLDSLAPFDRLSVRISVNLEPGAASGELNRVSVSGGESYLCNPVAAGSGKYTDFGCAREGGGKAFERAAVGPVPPASLTRPITVSGSAVPFGVEEYELLDEEEGGAPATQAASHPFQQTTEITLNQTADTSPPGTYAEEIHVNPSGLPKDVHFQWPPGLIGNPSGVAKCSDLAFFASTEGGQANLCPANSAVGVATVLLNEPSNTGVAEITVPLFNLEPHYGEPARFGFNVTQGNAPVVIDTSVRSDGDYGITVEADNITQTAALLTSAVTVWGVPGDPRHNDQRGTACLLESRGHILSGLGVPPCAATATQASSFPAPFTSLPTSCGTAQPTTVVGDSWANPLAVPDFQSLASYSMPVLDGCNKVPFSPTIGAEPTSNAATSPTGLNFDINFHDEGQTNAKGLIQSQLKKAVVTLPEGFTTNPSVAEGLHACPQAAYEGSTVDGSVACPENSKVGEVEIESPLITQKVDGSLYVARQGENPNANNLLTIYMVARNPEVGILVKQALKVVPNPVTGQLTTEVDNIPQLPFSHFHLSFRQGQRSPLVTPSTCGPYTVKAALYPYADPEVPVQDESSFQITQGPEGLGCPSGTPPFHPGLEAGTINNAAGTYSPFYTHITRKDSEQEITRFSIKLPTGLIAKLKGVSECSDAGVAAAKAREHEGGASEEEAHPSCPANSEVGHTLVGTGVGNVLAYAGGKLYLAGPYHGSPISLVSVNYAKVGPFDLGTVVVRFALDVNHETAEVSVDGANSDPIPHIVDGIPIHLRDIRAYVSRPDFTLNPTSCAKKSTAATVLGSGASFTSSADDVPVTVSSPFQAADCASLGFAPKLALSLTGKKTHRGALPAFKAVLTYPKQGAYANIAKAQVTLPGSEFLEQGHLKNVCTRKVFETGANPGENCPANSIYGHARATTPLLDAPLEGPVYLRTGYGTRLPELAAALNGPQISITLAGTIDSVHKKGVEGSRIRNTFSVVPDAPVEKFTLELKGGKKGLLVNSTDVCKGTHKALAAFTGQNGKLDEYEPALKAQCGKKGKKSGGKKKGSGKKAGH